MHSPHFVELSAYFNALLLWGQAGMASGVEGREEGRTS